MAPFRIVSADAHVLEPTHIWETWLPKQYQDKAATYRKEAQDHRDMAAAARDKALNAHKEHGQKDPSVVKMEKHCAALAAAADKLAIENEKAADFHNLRAKELQGK